MRAYSKKSMIAGALTGLFAVLGPIGGAQMVAQAAPQNEIELPPLYTPGKWQRMGAPDDKKALSLEVLMRAEEQTGAVFCKYRDAKGQWFSNLIDCRRDKRGFVDGMIDEPYGIVAKQVSLAPVRHDNEVGIEVWRAHRYVLANPPKEPRSDVFKGKLPNGQGFLFQFTPMK